jgi:PncC family amidohydrolase
MQECDLYDAEKTAQALVYKLKERKIKIALAESCTAGLVSNLLARTPGASSVLWGSFVCYTQDAKESMLSLDSGELDTYGLTSAETAYAMAAGALRISGADIAASVTGLAGPDGDGSKVPVGTVWVSTACKNGDISAKEFHFTGSRNDIRLQAANEVIKAIEALT